MSMKTLGQIKSMSFISENNLAYICNLIDTKTNYRVATASIENSLIPLVAEDCL